MSPQTNRKQEFTGDEFEQIIFEAQPNSDVAKAYFAEEEKLEGGTLHSHRPEDQIAGRSRGRYMLPSDYTGMITKMRENINSSDEMPYYHIRGKVEIIDKKVDWEIQLIRCVFTDEVNLNKLTSTKMLSISECVFLKGLTINESQLDSLFISNLDGHRIRINKSTIDVLSLSDLTLPLSILATSVKTISMFPSVK
jgi:hypothetical protein